MTDQELAKALRRSGARLLDYHNKLTSEHDRAEALHLVKLVSKVTVGDKSPRLYPGCP